MDTEEGEEPGDEDEEDDEEEEEEEEEGDSADASELTTGRASPVEALTAGDSRTNDED